MSTIRKHEKQTGWDRELWNADWHSSKAGSSRAGAGWSSDVDGASLTCEKKEEQTLLLKLDGLIESKGGAGLANGAGFNASSVGRFSECMEEKAKLNSMEELSFSGAEEFKMESVEVQGAFEDVEQEELRAFGWEFQELTELEDIRRRREANHSEIEAKRKSGAQVGAVGAPRDGEPQDLGDEERRGEEEKLSVRPVRRFCMSRVSRGAVRRRRRSRASRRM